MTGTEDVKRTYWTPVEVLAYALRKAREGQQ